MFKPNPPSRKTYDSLTCSGVGGVGGVWRGFSPVEGEGGVDYYLLALNPTLLYPPMLSIFSMGGAVGWASWLLGSSITSSLGISPEYLGTDPAGGGAPPVNQSIINLSITSFQLINNHSFNQSISKTPCQSISIIH